MTSAWDTVRNALDVRDSMHANVMRDMDARSAAQGALVKALEHERDAAKARLVEVTAQLRDLVVGYCPPAPVAQPAAVTSEERTTKCLMCDKPYGRVGGSISQCGQVVARCNHKGFGRNCFEGDTVSEYVDAAGPCGLSISEDCYACRHAAPVVTPAATVRPSKCLMCHEPYGSRTITGMPIHALCGCRGVGSTCCFRGAIGSSDFCDKRCAIDPDHNKCFACRQKQ